MKTFVGLYILFGIAYCVSIHDAELNKEWLLFKRVYEKQYASVEEEINR